MQPYETLSTQPSTPSQPRSLSFRTWFALAFLLIATIGFADATYLTVKHYTGSPITCSIVHGCDIVTSSPYSELFGIPVALFGALYYLTIILLSVAFFDKKRPKFLALLSKLTLLGLLAAIYFVSLQAFVLHAYCLYCLGSALSSTILCILGMIYLKKTRMPNPKH